MVDFHGVQIARQKDIISQANADFQVRERLVFFVGLSGVVQ